MRLVSGTAKVVALCGALVAPVEALEPPPQSASANSCAWVIQGVTPTQRFRDPLSVTCDPATGEVFVADTGNHEITIFDSNGTLRFRFPHFLENGEPGSPRCALQLADGRLLITDALSTAISVANARGEVMQRISPAALAGVEGRLSPGYLARDGQGFVYVTVSGATSGVLMLDASLAFVRFIHGQGHADGELTSPTGIAVGGDGRVIVTDPGATLAVLSFSPEGEFLGGFGRHESGRDNFSFPSGVSWIDGIIWVADAVRQVVKGMDPGGHLVTMLGGKGTGAGDMLYPVSVATDGGRRLYVLERAGARLQAFDLAEKPVASF
jgi:DNA-binding beta-propeller fold protein YncE